MAESVKNILKAAVKFHHKFGGDNGWVDRPSEVTQEAADCFSEMGRGDRKMVLDSIGSIGKPGQSIFDNKILVQLIKELENSHYSGATRAVRQILHYRALRETLLYCYDQAPNDLPPFVKISEATSNSNPQKSSDLEYLYLLVNRGQKPLPVTVTAEMLAGYRHPRIEVDGYVDSMMVVTKSKTNHITVDGTVWGPENKKYIGIGADCDKDVVALYYADEGRFERAYFYEDDDDRFPQVVLDSLSLTSVKSLQYFLASDFIDDLKRKLPDKTLSAKSSIPVDIGGYKIEIGHQGLKRLSDLGVIEPYYGVDFFLQGPKKKLASIPNLTVKLTSINNGIYEAQDVLGMDRIREVKIIAHSRENAWAHREIGFTTSKIAESSERALRLISRHETLHKLTSLLGLPGNSEILSYYLDRLGGDEGNPFGQSPDPTPFLKFITEKHFFAEPTAEGHPQSNVREFCVSFTQTLFDFEGLAGKLSRLPPDKKAEFLDHFISLTKLFAKTANENTAKGLFYKRYAQLVTLRTKWEEHDRSSGAGRHGARREVQPTRPGEVIYLSSIDELHARVKTASEEKRRTYVLISSSWCGPCKWFLPKFIERVEKSNDQFLILPVGDGREGWDLAGGHIPTVLLYSGSDVARPKRISGFALANMWSAGLEWYPDIYWP